MLRIRFSSFAPSSFLLLHRLVHLPKPRRIRGLGQGWEKEEEKVAGRG